MALEESAATLFMNRLTTAFADGDPNHGEKAAEQVNVKIVTDAFLAIAGNDLAKLKSLLAPDVALEVLGPSCVPFLGRWTGADAVGDAIWNNFSMVEAQQPELLSVIAQGDQVVVLGKERGKYRATGQDYRYTWVQFFTVRNGLIVGIRELVATELP